MNNVYKIIIIVLIVIVLLFFIKYINIGSKLKNIIQIQITKIIPPHRYKNGKKQRNNIS